MPELGSATQLYLPAIAGLVKLLREKKVHVLETIFIQSDILGVIAAMIAGTPYVMSSVRGVLIPERTSWFKRALYTSLYKLAQKRFDVIEALSMAAKRDLCQTFGVPEVKVRVVPIGVDLDELSEDALLPATGQNKLAALEYAGPLVGVACVLSWQKGVVFFIDSIPIVRQQFPTARFVVIGDGDQRGMLEARAAKLGISDRVDFLGWVSPASAAMRYLDIVVLPSTREGMSWTLVEAMALGKPVVASKVGGMVEVVVDGKTGYLVKPRSSTALAEGICKLLADPDRARQIGVEGASIIQQCFTAQRMAREVEQIYEQLLARGSR